MWPPIPPPPAEAGASLPPSLAIRRSIRDGGQTDWDGVIGVSWHDSDFIRSLLPPSYTLAERIDGGLTHPAVFLDGQHRNLTIIAGGRKTRASHEGYAEFILLIPYVIDGVDPNRWMNFALAMYLEDDILIRMGRRYAYPKRKGRRECGAWIDEKTNKIVFQEEALEPDPTIEPDLTWISDMMIAPVLAVDGSGPLCSAWQWSGGDNITALKATHFIPLLGGVCSGPAYRVEGLQWRMSVDTVPCL